jgi:hypothetical protein
MPTRARVRPAADVIIHDGMLVIRTGLPMESNASSAICRHVRISGPPDVDLSSFILQSVNADVGKVSPMDRVRSIISSANQVDSAFLSYLEELTFLRKLVTLELNVRRSDGDSSELRRTSF